MQREFVRDIVVRLESLGVPYAITGSIASNLWGTPRTTHDIDVVVVLSLTDVSSVVAAFAEKYFLSENAIRDAIRSTSMFNVIDTSRGLKVDFWVTRDDSFNESMLQRRRRTEIVPGQQAWVGTPEDVLLHKLVWHNITPSERQLADAAGIAAVQAGNLDLTYMRSWVARQGTGTLLEEVLEGKYLKKT